SARGGAALPGAASSRAHGLRALGGRALSLPAPRSRCRRRLAAPPHPLLRPQRRPLADRGALRLRRRRRQPPSLRGRRLTCWAARGLRRALIDCQPFRAAEQWERPTARELDPDTCVFATAEENLS